MRKYIIENGYDKKVDEITKLVSNYIIAAILERKKKKKEWRPGKCMTTRISGNFVLLILSHTLHSYFLKYNHTYAKITRDSQGRGW